jgi:uncharacterized SAM-binding protein YcdF (DUF218 family)
MRRVCGLLATGVGLAWVICGVQIDAVGRRVDAVPAECAIVVLGARVEAGGRASETLAARVRLGIELHRATKGRLLVFSGGVGDVPPAESEVGRALALTAGILDREILVEADSHSTRQNARETARLLRARGISCVHLVTDPYHQARARWAFEREGFTVTAAPVMEAPRHRALASRILWTAREVPAFAKMMLSE